MFKFCPNCTKEIQPGWKCCPYCGYSLSEPQKAAVGGLLDNALDGLMEAAKEQNAKSEKSTLLNKLRVMIIRGQYDEAKAVCDELIDNDPMDMAVYINLIRIASQNYKLYEGADIEEQMRVAEEVFGGSDKLESDHEYAQYVANRKKYFEDKAAQAERKRIAEIFRIEGNCLKRYKGKGGNVVIPNSVTIIEKEAFRYCSSMTSIKILNSVVSIGELAFANCSGLTSIEIPNNVTSIGSYAFYDCSSLTSIVIPNSVTSISDNAFNCCSSLTCIEIPNSVTSIGDGTFANCSSLTSIEIPNSVTSIGSYAFYDCYNLTSASIPSVCKIGTYAFPRACKVTRR